MDAKVIDNTANNRKPTNNKEVQMNNDDLMAMRGRKTIEAMSEVNEPSYWYAGDKNRATEDFSKAGFETKDIDEKTFNEMHLDYSPVYHMFLKSLDKYQKKNNVDIAVFCATVNALGQLFMNGARVMIPMLIHEAIAAYILGIKTEELHNLKFLHSYRFNSKIYYLNNEVYDYLDRRRYGKNERNQKD